jgi:16S rRNA (adenine1518-N6/adenine1519-N6)-dimethyltransferase
VDSAVITLQRRDRESVSALNESRFESLVRRGFSERRKQLRKMLPELKPEWDALTSKLGLPPTVRAEELSLKKWELLAAMTSPAQAQHPEELFDVVDEQDVVLRPETRDVVHVNNLRHRAVHMLLFNSQGELFLQKRSMWKDRNPGLWDSSAAGHVDSGENYIQAAHRELQEELGIAPPELVSFGRLTPSPTTGWEFIELYRGSHEGPFQPAPMEIETGAFFEIEHIVTWAKNTPTDFSPVFLKCLECLQSPTPIVI